MTQRSPSLESKTPLIGKSLTRISKGRLFCRPTDRNEGVTFIGVVALPRSIEGETLHNFRFKGGLWLDTAVAGDPLERLGRLGGAQMTARNLGEMDASELLGLLTFSKQTMPDVLEMLVRRTHLEHEDPDMTWSLVLGVRKKKPAALAGNGLYEVQGKVLHLIDTDLHTNTHLSNLLRLPLWGAEGQFGMATSMEPSRFPRWAQENRPNIKDPIFQAYVAEMEKIAPMPMVYTQQEQRDRQRIGMQVRDRIVAQEKAKAAASAPQRKP